jgi:hypothetical protein
MNFFKKTIIFFRVIRNYNQFQPKINNIYYFKNPFVLFFYIFFDKIYFLILKIISKKKIINLIKKNYLSFSVRAASLNEKKEISFFLQKKKNFLKDKSNFIGIKKLKEDGFFYLGNIFSKKACDFFIKSLRHQFFFNSQVPMQSNGILYKFSENEFKKKRFQYYTFLLNNLFKYRELMDFLISKKLNRIIKGYLGFDPRIYSVLTWLNFPQKEKHYVHQVHRDYDDFKFLSLIINWTDVSKENGATRFIRSSHARLLNSYEKEKLTTYLTGSAGSVYLADTYGLHSGTPLIKGYRVVTWARYGRLINAATLQDKFMQTPILNN